MSDQQQQQHRYPQHHRSANVEQLLHRGQDALVPMERALSHSGPSAITVGAGGGASEASSSGGGGGGGAGGQGIFNQVSA